MLTAMRHLRHAAFLGMLALAAVAPAAAATITFTDSLPDVAMPNPVATGTSSLTTVLSENVTGSIVNVRRSPWDAGNSTVDFTAQDALYTAVQNGTAYFDLGVVRGGISFVWGTPGPQNVLELFLNGVSQFQVTGTGAVSPNEATYSRLTTVSDVRFDRITFTAAKPAFEFANLTISAVPLPAGGLLLLGALGGLMMLRRRSII